MKVAVTGASGFCGRAIVAALVGAGHDVTTVGRRPLAGFPHRYWDAGRGAPTLDEDAVVHAAALVVDGGSAADHRRVTIDGTAEIASTGVAMVHISSASVYGPHTGSVDETARCVPRFSRYAAAKLQAERHAAAASAVILRPRAVYGPGDPYLEPRLVASVRRGTVVMPGANRPLSLTHVNNLGAAVVDSLSWAPGVYNVADSISYQRDDVVVAVCRAHGLDVVLRRIPVTVAFTAAAFLGRFNPGRLSRYAVDQLANPIVLEVGKACAAGYAPLHDLGGYLSTVCASGRSSRT